MNWKPVNTKRDFVRRYKLNEFGNHAPTWDTVRELRNSEFMETHQGRLHLRSRIKGGPTWYDVPFCDVYKTLAHVLEKHGAEYLDQLYFSAMCPHECGLIQGEIMQTEKGLNLFWGGALLPMREAMRTPFVTVTGLTASNILKSRMDANSWDWLQVLLDRYPFHVIEFTTLSKCWGTIPNYNTIFWEVRNY